MKQTISLWGFQCSRMWRHVVWQFFYRRFGGTGKPWRHIAEESNRHFHFTLISRVFVPDFCVIQCPLLIIGRCCIFSGVQIFTHKGNLSVQLGLTAFLDIFRRTSSRFTCLHSFHVFGHVFDRYLISYTCYPGWCFRGFLQYLQTNTLNSEAT
jgi:hypothetical protein